VIHLDEKELYRRLSELSESERGIVLNYFLLTYALRMMNGPTIPLDTFADFSPELQLGLANLSTYYIQGKNSKLKRW
jgi:hypothetical protein